MTVPTRRDVLLGLGLTSVAAVVAACTGGSTPAPVPSPTGSGGSGPTTAGSSPSAGRTTSSASTSARASTRMALPPARRWTARPGEVNPAVKRLATDVAQIVGTWPSAGSGTTSAKRRLAAAGHDPVLADSLRLLLPEAGSAVTWIVDAQYGGILTSSASVLTVARQWYLTADGVRHEHGTTLDIRLVGSGNRWRVTQILPADPGPTISRLTTAARSVLANSRIHLPEACVADIRSGHIHDSVLDALTTLSRRHVLDVSILRSGHPYHVFGTNRVSDHPRGRAADVWAVDGHAVVDPANRALVVAFMREASATGPWQVGGPVDLDGAAKAFFSDLTHHDHVHMGFRS